jgi:hypothetical protein
MIFGVRGKRVRYVAVVDASLHSKRALRTQLRRAALIKPVKKSKR